MSERLGHATAAFTLQVYTHVIPGMDQQAASTVADLILGQIEEARAGWSRIGSRQSQHPWKKKLTWAKAQVSGSSGGRI